MPIKEISLDQTVNMEVIKMENEERSTKSSSLSNCWNCQGADPRMDAGSVRVFISARYYEEIEEFTGQEVVIQKLYDEENQAGIRRGKNI